MMKSGSVAIEYGPLEKSQSIGLFNTGRSGVPGAKRLRIGTAISTASMTSPATWRFVVDFIGPKEYRQALEKIGTHLN
jgi:hypothetical protein